jgi:hypothetical protein
MSQTSAILPSGISTGDVTSVDPSQPQTTSGASKFGQILGKIATTAATTAANIAAPGLGGLLGSKISSGLLNNNPIQYLQLQQQMLAEARAYETVSTVLKAKHDSAMSAIRNMRSS